MNKQITAFYIGWIGHDNLGDEILFDAHRQLFPDWHWQHFHPKHPLTEKPDIVFLGGGTLIGRANLAIDYLQNFIDSGIPVVCIGTGVANPEFWSTRNREFVDILPRWAKLLHGFKYVGVRGPLSQAILTQYGFSGSQVVGDTAVALAQDTYKPPSQDKTIGLNIGHASGNMWLDDEENWLAIITQTVQQLLNNGWKIKLLPVWPKDLAINQKLSSNVNSPNCQLIEAYQDYHQYLREIESCQIFIGEKLHATIIATMNRIPSIMLEYRPKCRDYMMSIGMEEYNLRVDKTTPETIIQAVENLSNNQERVVSKLNTNILDLKNHLYSARDDIVKILNKK